MNRKRKRARARKRGKRDMRYRRKVKRAMRKLLTRMRFGDRKFERACNVFLREMDEIPPPTPGIPLRAGERFFALIGELPPHPQMLPNWEERVIDRAKREGLIPDNETN